MGPQVATVEPATIHHIPVEVELVTSEQGVQIVPRGSGQEDYVYSVTVRNAGRNTAQFRLVGGTLS